MQVNVVFEPPQVKPQNGSFDEDDDDEKSKQSGGESDNEDKKNDHKLTEDQKLMKSVLESKKQMVVQELIKKLSHRNYKDTEASLNAKAVLIDLIETEKTFELFMANKAKLIG